MLQVTLKASTTSRLRSAASLSEAVFITPEAALTRHYREFFENRQKLVREDLKAAFSRLVEMRAIH